MIQPAKYILQLRNDYPTSDGKPMAETPIHRNVMVALIYTLEAFFADDPSVYVSGNMLVFYEKGDKRRHVAPDVFVVPGIGNHYRPNYLLWEERHGLDLVIEVTSKSTKKEDIDKKYRLYESKLGVKEYFLFDPLEEYLEPSFQGYRKGKTGFRPIKPLDGRLPSKVLSLHLARVGADLRFWNPITSSYLMTPAEKEAARAELAERKNVELARELAELRAKLSGSTRLNGHR